MGKDLGMGEVLFVADKALVSEGQRGAPDTALLSLDAERAIDTNLEFMCTLAWEGIFCKMDLIAL